MVIEGLVNGNTANPLTSEETSLPVVSVTVRGPCAAAGSMLSVAVAPVEELTVNDVTLIPAPKLAEVVPCTKWVNWPVIVTGIGPQF